MDLNTRIDRLLKRLEGRGFPIDTVQIYAEGVREKTAQVDYALSRIQSLQALEMYGTTTQGSAPLETTTQISTNDQISFYCDSIWDFLWSAVDITSQLVNVVLGLGIAERWVNFNKLASFLSRRHPNNIITTHVLELQRSLALKQLGGYRHCSTHRRPVYMQAIVNTTTVIGRAGYSSVITEPVTQTISRLLCDNPKQLVPKLTDREVISYCGKLKRQIEHKISRIINPL